MKVNDKLALYKAYESLKCPPLHNIPGSFKKRTPSKDKKDLKELKEKSKKVLPYLAVTEKLGGHTSRK